MVTGGLIQAAAPLTDPSAPIERIRQAAIDVHVPLIEEAGRKGVQILGLQEVFNAPYFCPSQDAHWYDLAEPVPGPTTEFMGQYARKYRMAMVVPVYEREQAGRERGVSTGGTLALWPNKPCRSHVVPTCT